MIYLDACAVVKLTRQEAETDALRAWIAQNPRPLASSALVRAEAVRALVGTEPGALPVLHAVLAVLHLRPITDAVLDAAARLPAAALPTLGAIHVATADDLRHALTAFVTYDRRQAAAARAHDLPVVSPA